MPSNLVKSPSDARHWRMAKQRAAEEGHAKDWPYVVGIFERMKGGHKKTAAINPLTYLKDLWHNASGHASAPFAAAKRKAMKRLEQYNAAHLTAAQRSMNAARYMAAGNHGAEGAVRRAGRSEGAWSKNVEQAAVEAGKAQKDFAEADLKRRSAQKKLVLGAGGLTAAGLAAKSMLGKKKEPEGIKEAADKKEDRGINWKRLAVMGAGTGLLVGGVKGYGEEAIKNLIKRKAAMGQLGFLKHLGVRNAEKAEQVGRSLGRGVTSAGGGVVYATGTALGMKKDKKERK